MAQYLISVLYDAAELATADEDGRDRRLQRAAPGRRPLGLRRRPRLARHGHRRRRPGRGGGVHRRALPGVEGVHRRLLDHRGRRPRRGAPARRRRVEDLQPQGRAAAVPVSDRRRRGDHPGPPRGVGPGGRDPGQALRRPRHRRGDGRRGVRDRRRALAGRRRPAQSRRVADHHRPPQGHRPAPARGQARGEAQGGADAVRHTRPSRSAPSTTTGSAWSSPAATPLWPWRRGSR